MELQYNGHNYSKRFSRQLIALMCAEATTPCDAMAGVDWRRSSRRCLRVRDARVFARLQRCSERYFWPDGVRFWCRARQRQQSPIRRRRRRQQSPTRRRQRVALLSPTARENDASLDDYAKMHGYDQEDGKLTPLSPLFSHSLDNIYV
ncbi:LEF-6 [Dione juno nucleopolyhedrovirus]|uniref:LEF-6 n=1 Tax=Dione juno nucleopolyhedrovirus TaxID=2594175 RepID=A0AAE6H317_9ABAC|nr:LEF-6 [Dione juno nucleopolyhedrovirus]QDL56993.1 LEF-6 [Dione juno nucleopolyhedrovirus]